MSAHPVDSKRANRNFCGLERLLILVPDGDGEVFGVPAYPQSFSFFSFLYAVVAMTTFLLVAVRLLYPENRSLFEARGVFIIMAIVSGSLCVLSSAILILASFLRKSWMKDVHYTILKTIGSFSASLVPFSLGAIVFLPLGDLNWIAYTVLCVTAVGFLYLYSLIWKVACAYHEEKHFNSYPVHWAFLLIILVPFSIALVPFFTPNLWWALICLSFSIIVLSCIAFMRFNREDKEVLPQDKTVDHP